MLNEAIYNVSLKTYYPFSMWLKGLSDEIEIQGSGMNKDGVFKDFYSLWCESLESLKEHTLLTNKELGQIYDVGKALGYLDIESQQMNLNLERELIHKHILDMDKDINTRMKNAIILCFLGGIMTVIALI